MRGRAGHELDSASASQRTCNSIFSSRHISAPHKLPLTRPSLSTHPDLKPENVLICIDDVESIIQAELASAALLASSSTSPSSPSNPNLSSGGPHISVPGVMHNAPTKLVGVPPSRGRGGNQTPRSESVFITGSQPLPSPSSSYGASPMLDKWAFGMSKIEDGGSVNGGSSLKAQVEDAVEDGGPGGDEGEGGGGGGEGTKRGLSAEMDSASERISKLMKDEHGHTNHSHNNNDKHAQSAGPSLLSQQAPPRNGQQPPQSPQPAEVPSISSSSRGKAGLVDSGGGEGVAGGEEGEGEPGTGTARASVSSASSMPLDGTERITVKIADLGNGAFLLLQRY